MTNILAQFAKRSDYHQSTQYARVMEQIGWRVHHLDGGNLFIRQIGPVAFAKLQRPKSINLSELISVQKKKRIVCLVVEPGLRGINEKELLLAGFKVSNLRYAYTKTLVIDIKKSLADILKSFSRSLSYQMLASQKKGVVYENVPFKDLSMEQKNEVLKLHNVWTREKKVAGYDDAFIKSLWGCFPSAQMIFAKKEDKLIGVLFLLMHDKVGMYFYQFASLEARSGLLVPSGLAFHAIKISKENNCEFFDLCSAYDERYPNVNLGWKGFTTHKSRFHPESIYYPRSYVHYMFPWLS